MGHSPGHKLHASVWSLGACLGATQGAGAVPRTEDGGLGRHRPQWALNNTCAVPKAPLWPFPAQLGRAARSLALSPPPPPAALYSRGDDSSSPRLGRTPTRPRVFPGCHPRLCPSSPRPRDGEGALGTCRLNGPGVLGPPSGTGPKTRGSFTSLRTSTHLPGPTDCGSSAILPLLR